MIMIGHACTTYGGMYLGQQGCYRCYQLGTAMVQLSAGSGLLTSVMIGLDIRIVGNMDNMGVWRVITVNDCVKYVERRG